MNALKNGRYAERPDPVELVLASYGEDDEAEREALRQDHLSRYQPPNEFAAAEVEELADLRFELRRLERTKQVLWQHERKLLAIEQKKRRRALYDGRIEGSARDIGGAGLISAPDSFEKFCEIAESLERALGRLEAGDFERAEGWLHRVFGYTNVLWRGESMLGLLERSKEGAANPQAGWAREKLATEIELELRNVEHAREIWIDEHQNVDEIEQAARLLEMTASRSWAWIRREENALRRAIDRKVRILIKLREQAGRKEPAAGGRGSGARTQEPEGRRQEPEVRSLKSEVSVIKPRVRNAEYRKPHTDVRGRREGTGQHLPGSARRRPKRNSRKLRNEPNQVLWNQVRPNGAGHQWVQVPPR